MKTIIVKHDIIIFDFSDFNNIKYIIGGDLIKFFLDGKEYEKHLPQLYSNEYYCLNDKKNNIYTFKKMEYSE